MRCLVVILSVLAAITLFYVGFDRFENQGGNLLPEDTSVFLLKKRNKPLGVPSPTIDGAVRFNLKPKESIEFQLEAPPPGRFLRLSGKVQTKDLLPGNKPWHQSRLLLIAKDIDGRRIAGLPHEACRFDGVTDWTHCSQTWLSPATRHRTREQ